VERDKEMHRFYNRSVAILSSDAVVPRTNLPNLQSNAADTVHHTVPAKTLNELDRLDPHTSNRRAIIATRSSKPTANGK